MDDKPHILLHVCCGPCATAVLEQLVERFHVTAFWHNPNIQPREEHDRRLEQARVVAREFDIDIIIAERNEEEWLEAVAGFEDEPEGGARCPVCFEFRLRRAAEEAARQGAEYVATTLTVSPHKPADGINAIGREVAEAVGVEFIEEDFKKQGGFQRSVELSKELGLYRQRYCGCLFGKRGPTGEPPVLRDGEGEGEDSPAER